MRAIGIVNDAASWRRHEIRETRRQFAAQRFAEIGAAETCELSGNAVRLRYRRSWGYTADADAVDGKGYCASPKTNVALGVVSARNPAVDFRLRGSRRTAATAATLVAAASSCRNDGRPGLEEHRRRGDRRTIGSQRDDRNRTRRNVKFRQPALIGGSREIRWVSHQERDLPFCWKVWYRGRAGSAIRHPEVDRNRFSGWVRVHQRNRHDQAGCVIKRHQNPA